MSVDEQKLARRFAELSPEARSAFLARMQEAGLVFAELPIVPALRERGEGTVPMSYAQRGLWLTWKLNPASAAYNMAGTLRFKGALDVAALMQALHALVERHEILRTIYAGTGDGEPVQRLVDGGVEVPETDLRGVPPGERTEAAQRLWKAFAELPFKLDAEAPFRLALWHLDDDDHALGIALHHIAGDGWSMRLLADDLLTFYRQACGEDIAAPAPLAVQFSDYAVWQRNWFEAGEKERQLRYWRQQLGDEHVPLALPFDRPRGGAGNHGEGRRAFVLPFELSNALRGVARASQASLFMVMLAVFKLVLRRYSGQTNVSVGAPIANRQRSETHAIVAYLTNVQVLRTSVDLSATFADLLSAVREVVLAGQSHPDLPFDLLVEALKPERQVGVHPLFQVKCTQQEDVPARWRLPSAEVSIEGISSGEAHFDLSLDFYDRPDGIEAVLVYSEGLFDASTVARFERAFILLAGQVAVRPDARLETLDIGEALGVLDGGDGAFAFADVLQMWDAAVGRTPDRPAVRAEERSYTFAQIDARADELSAGLLAQGAGPDARVGVYAERSCEFVLGVLAALKAGAAYVPLDPALPAERLAYQLRDSQATVLMAARPADWQTELPVIALHFAPDHAAAPAKPAKPAKPLAPHGRQAAYLIYTSGSTGQPKGVLIDRAGLANYVQAVLARLALPDDATEVAMVSTVAADLGHTSLFGALCSGRTLHLISAARAFDPDQFARYMSDHRIDVLKIVPSHFQALLQCADQAGAVPRHCLILGGEATSWQLLEQIRALRPACRIVNHYGPTETTVGVLTQPAGSANASAATLPLGLPLSHTRALVLDAELSALPQGIAGELYLCGAGVARGYQGRAGLTADRFVASLAAPGERMYRTGDRVRQLVDGGLEFLGRTDDQVKVRGFRVELDAVTSALEQAVDCCRATTVMHNGKLVGFVSPATAVPEQARKAVAERLPYYCVPTLIVPVDTLPTTDRGKVDRRALLSRLDGQKETVA